MKYLGIDYGSKKTGLALTDESGKMAFPHSVVPTDAKLLKIIESLIMKEKVGEIVLGYSLNRDGKPNTIHAAAEELMLDLTLAVGLPVHLQPEQYTTQAAIQLQGRNTQTDASAAALILDAYLIKQK